MRWRLSLLTLTQLLFLHHMRRKKWGRVVTITSILGGKDGNARPWFAMAKVLADGTDEEPEGNAELSGALTGSLSNSAVALGLIDVGKPGLRQRGMLAIRQDGNAWKRWPTWLRSCAATRRGELG